MYKSNNHFWHVSVSWIDTQYDDVTYGEIAITFKVPIFVGRNFRDFANFQPFAKINLREIALFPAMVDIFESRELLAKLI